MVSRPQGHEPGGSYELFCPTLRGPLKNRECLDGIGLADWGDKSTPNSDLCRNGFWDGWDRAPKNHAIEGGFVRST